MVTFITLKWKRFLKFYLAKMALFFAFLIFFTVYIYWLFKRPSSGDPHANFDALEEISVHHSFPIVSTVFGVLLFLHLIVHLLWEVFLYKKPRHRNSPHDLMMLFTEGVEMGTDVGIFPLHC